MTLNILQSVFKGFLRQEDGFLVEYLLLFLGKLQVNETQTDILKRLISSLTHRSVAVGDKSMCTRKKIFLRRVASNLFKDFQKLHNGTLGCTMEFFQSLLEIVVNHHNAIKEESYCAQLLPES